MVKLVIFDLDGVLIDAKDIHYEALNRAIAEVNPDCIITRQEHLTRYDGLPTRTKLIKLTEDKGLNPNKYDYIFERKQFFTIKAFKKFRQSAHLQFIFGTLKNLHHCKIAVASNSIRETILVALESLGLLNMVDLIMSNEDVTNPKPNPEIYMRCMVEMGVAPFETVIVEDSVVGRMAAEMSGAILCPVNYPSDVRIEKIEALMNEKIKRIKWKDEKLNVLIPMAGAGSRFQEAGYTFPKPLIEVMGEPMIKVVVDNLNIEANYIFIVQKTHYDKYNLKYLLELIAPGCTIIIIDGVTEGAACTTLLARGLIDSDDSLIIANSDQWIDWDSHRFLYSMRSDQVDGGIATFHSVHPKWSFAKTDDYGYVTEVAEKKPISETATVGVYFWKHGSDYVKYADQMIAKDIRVNNEFYVCPVFNEAIADGKKIKTYSVDKMMGIGTPEDLEIFLTWKQGQ